MQKMCSPYICKDRKNTKVCKEIWMKVPFYHQSNSRINKPKNTTQVRAANKKHSYGKFILPAPISHDFSICINQTMALAQTVQNGGADVTPEVAPFWIWNGRARNGVASGAGGLKTLRWLRLSLGGVLFVIGLEMQFQRLCDWLRYWFVF